MIFFCQVLDVSTRLCEDGMFRGNSGGALFCDTIVMCTFERLVKGSPAAVCRKYTGVVICYE